MKKIAWVTEQAQNFDVIIDDISQDTAMIALQGPEEPSRDCQTSV